MIDRTTLVNFFAAHCPDIQGVDEYEVDHFLEKSGLKLRPEHREFLIKYGNSKKIVANGFSNCTFDKFKSYYVRYFNNDFENEEIAFQERVPNGTVYFGQDFSDDLLCVESESGCVSVYYKEDIDLIVYKNIDSFLFYCFYVGFFLLIYLIQ